MRQLELDQRKGRIGPGFGRDERPEPPRPAVARGRVARTALRNHTRHEHASYAVRALNGLLQPGKAHVAFGSIQHDTLSGSAAAHLRCIHKMEPGAVRKREE
jgi:hypothetical protein